MSHADEQILKQGARFRRMPLQKFQVLRNAIDRVHLQAPRDPPQDGRAFVMLEIMSGLVADMRQHFLQDGFVFRSLAFRPKLSRHLARQSPSLPARSASEISGDNCSRLSFWTNSSNFAGIFATGSTQSTMPVLIAVSGMLSYSASCGSCATVTPPCARICFNPITPSESRPGQDHRDGPVSVRLGEGAEK